VVAVKHGAAARGHDLAAAGQAIRQRGALAGAETRLALAIEDGGDAGAGAPLDLLVKIHEHQPEARGQAPADRGFPCAHRADQDEVLSRLHGAMLAAWRLVAAGGGGIRAIVTETGAWWDVPAVARPGRFQTKGAQPVRWPDH